MRRQEEFFELRSDIGAIRNVLTFEILTPSSPQRKKQTRNVQPGGAFEDSACKPVFEIVKF